MWLFFSVFSFLEFLNLPGSFLNCWKKQFPMQQNSFQLHCCAKELNVTLFFPFLSSVFCTYYRFSALTLMGLPLWQCEAAAVLILVYFLWDACIIGDLFVSGKGLKALSAADIPGCHFDVRPLSWEIRQHKERGLYPLQKSCICCLHSLVFILSSETNPKCLIGSLFGFCSE